MNRNKAAKPDEIVREMLLDLDDSRINKTNKMINEMTTVQYKKMLVDLSS